MSCNHSGDYTIRTAIAGHTHTRIYVCACGHEMAMDTLPQHLLKRMWGQPQQGQVKCLPKVDFCVTVGGRNALLLSRIFFWSLNEVVANWERVTVHLINRDLQDGEFHAVSKIADRCPTVVRKHTRPPRPSPARDVGEDVAWTCGWVSANCGSEDFVILSHFDIFFFRDFLTLIRSSITPLVGMLGQHCPIMALNRYALSRCSLLFETVPRLYAVQHETNPNQLYLYHPHDPRAAGATMSTGFDMGELLELEMRCRGWLCDPMRAHMADHFYHFTGGDRVRSGPELDYIQRRAQMFIEEYQIP